MAEGGGFDILGQLRIDDVQPASELDVADSIDAGPASGEDHHSLKPDRRLAWIGDRFGYDGNKVAEVIDNSSGFGAGFLLADFLDYFHGFFGFLHIVAQVCEVERGRADDIERQPFG